MPSDSENRLRDEQPAEPDVEGHRSGSIFAVKDADEQPAEPDVEGHRSGSIFAVKDADEDG